MTPLTENITLWCDDRLWLTLQIAPEVTPLLSCGDKQRLRATNQADST